MLTAVQSVLSVILMIAVGFALAKNHWFDAGGTTLISRLVVNVALLHI